MTGSVACLETRIQKEEAAGGYEWCMSVFVLNMFFHQTIVWGNA